MQCMLQNIQRKQYLTRHSKICGKKEKCRTCGKEYANSDSLKRHNETVHVGKEHRQKKTVTCEGCGETSKVITVTKNM